MKFETALTQKKTRYREAFFIALLAAFLFFLPYIIYDKGYFFFFGDFNAQQIPFYKLAHEAIRSGNLEWNWNTDLGVNFIGSYSFYLLGSPFFWITLLFPNSWVPYLLAPLLMLKFATASLTAYCYLQRHVKNPDYALIGALLYAFSGFSTYNIFFNHFHEVIAFFPLLLLGLDCYMEENRRGVFAFAIMLNCLVNYFFFMGEVIFVVIYWVFRMLDGRWKLNFRKFFFLAFEAVMGLLASAILLLPALMAIMGNPRLSELYYGWSALLYSKSQMYAYIVQSLFFMPELPARPVFFPGADVKWSSVAGWLPLFGMTGVLSFCLARKKNWLKRILVTSAVIALIPILNSTFYLFRSNYYARWFYMPILLMALATAKAFEEKDIDWVRGVKWTAIVTAAIAIPIGLMPAERNEEGAFTKFGLFSRDFDIYPARFWLYVTVAVLCLIIVMILIPHLKKEPKRFFRNTMVYLLSTIVLTNAYFIVIGKTYSEDDHLYLIPKAIEGGENISLPDESFYRIDVLDGMDNIAMYWGYPCIHAFHSIVPPSVTEFYDSIGVDRGVASRPEAKHYPLRSLLSVEYVFVDNTPEEFEMPGYQDIGIQNGFRVWRNKNHIPMGFTYDRYITRSEYDSLTEEAREQILLQCLVIPNDKAKEISQVLNHFDGYETAALQYEDFEAACRDRKVSSCQDFSYKDNLFTASIACDTAQPVFFSVPYDEGWSATVNGKEVEILKANVGFMAVMAEKGSNEIVFTYQTPGLSAGILLSGGAVFLLIAYISAGYVVDRRRRKKEAVPVSGS